jgi:hypothetical protein
MTFNEVGSTVVEAQDHSRTGVNVCGGVEDTAVTTNATVAPSKQMRCSADLIARRDIETSFRYPRLFKTWGWPVATVAETEHFARCLSPLLGYPVAD